MHAVCYILRVHACTQCTNTDDHKIEYHCTTVIVLLRFCVSIPVLLPAVRPERAFTSCTVHAALLMMRHMDSHTACADTYVSHAEAVGFLFNTAGRRQPHVHEKQATWEKMTEKKHWAEKATGRERTKETERSHAEAESLLTTLPCRKTDGCTNTQTHTQPNRITHARRKARREGN